MGSSVNSPVFHGMGDDTQVAFHRDFPATSFRTGKQVCPLKEEKGLMIYVLPMQLF